MGYGALASWLVWLWPAAALLASTARPAGVTLTPQEEHQFGQYIRISVRIQTRKPVARVMLFVHPQGGLHTYTHPMQVRGEIWEYTFSPKDWPLPAFALVYYWFQLTYADGTQETSPSYTFIYTDNRFPWHHVSLEPVHLYWYQGPPDMPQTVLNAALAALQRIRSQWHAPQPERIEIYLYPDPEAYREVFTGQPEWAQAYAQENRIFLLANLDAASLERYVAHEMGHVLQYAAVGRHVHRLPWWLQEGLASLAEPDMAPAYRQALHSAALYDAWIPLRTLCRVPTFETPSQVILAYAEAASFVGYVHRTYGSQALARLVQTYATGAGCDQGVQQVLKRSLKALENDWKAQEWAIRRSLLESPQLPAFLTWLAAFAVLLASAAAALYMVYRQPGARPHQRT